MASNHYILQISHQSIWGQQDPSGPHTGPMNFATWDVPLALSRP